MLHLCNAPIQLCKPSSSNHSHSSCHLFDTCPDLCLLLSTIRGLTLCAAGISDFVSITILNYFRSYPVGFDVSQLYLPIVLYFLLHYFPSKTPMHHHLENFFLISSLSSHVVCLLIESVCKDLPLKKSPKDLPTVLIL